MSSVCIILSDIRLLPLGCLLFSDNDLSRDGGLSGNIESLHKCLSLLLLFLLLTLATVLTAPELTIDMPGSPSERNIKLLLCLLSMLNFIGLQCQVVK